MTITIIIIIQWVKKAADIGEFLNLVLMGSVIFDSDVENFLLKLPAYLPAWPASVFLHENPACKLRHVCGCLLKFHPADFVCFFFQERTGLISLSDWSWRLLLHGYLTTFQQIIDQVKLQAFSVLCAHFVHLWSRGHECS